MTDREAMKQALEALEMTYSVATNQWQAITALRARMKQPEQEHHQPWCDSVTKLLLSNPPQIPPCNCKQPEQEPVAWMDRDGDLYRMPVIENWSPPHTLLYTQPPQRKPLTEKEIEDIWVATDVPILGATYIKLVRQIEAAHGIKGKSHEDSQYCNRKV